MAESATTNSLGFSAYISVLDNEEPPLPLSALTVEEAYNAGWHCNALLATPASAAVNLNTLLSLAIQSGLRPGTPVALIAASSSTGDLTFLEGDHANGVAFSELPDGAVVRIWPSVVTHVVPDDISDETIGNVLSLVLADPLTYLADRPIWGAYRLTSVAQMVGGAISLAAGGDGKPTLTPILPGLPRVTVVNQLREELNIVPYSVAAGETFGNWLDSLSRLLGIRQEMRMNADGSLEFVLSDQAVSGTPPLVDTPEFRDLSSKILPDRYTGGGNVVALNVVRPDRDRDEADRTLGDLTIGDTHIIGVSTNPNIQHRGILLDDPFLGSFLNLGNPGAVGTVVSGVHLSVDEAVRRATYPLFGSFVEAFRVEATTRNPGLRPGRMVVFNEKVLNISTWQAFLVRHLFRGNLYDNEVTLFSASYSWHPASFESRPPNFVTAQIDGGDDLEEADPVSRDRLGRVPVRLSFLPNPVGEEGLALELSDENEDGRLTLDEFDEEALQDYEDNEDEWEAKLAAYRSGDYNDPYPDREDSELSEDELEERRVNRERREEALQYLGAKQAKTRAANRAESEDDDDNDNNALNGISDELRILLDEPGARERIEEQLAAREAGTLTDDFEGDELIDEELLDEYQSTIGSSGQDSDITNEEREERWPPRIPITSIESMAGIFHGFIPAHRQGDICRVAVHNPLFVEMVGYQYRSDRQINESLVGASAGMVVDHDRGAAWSGFVFRPTDALENPLPPPSSPSADEPE